jgi:hypothetical protein
MASLVDHAATLREVQRKAEALGLGFKGATPRAMFDCLKSSLPILARTGGDLRRPGQKRAHARILAQGEELLVALAAALYSRNSADEERAVDEARKLCRLLVEVRPTLSLPRNAGQGVE